VDQAVQFALAGDFDRLCALGTSQCKFIVHVTTVPNVEKTAGTWTPGGVLFCLCGLDGRGQPYHSQMEPVFWGSLTIDGPPVAEPKPTDADGVWQGCPN
jgi:hypothetical protein